MQTIELIRLRLLMRSNTYDELVQWMARNRPRVMRDAVGVLLVRLRHRGQVRIQGGRWETCRPVLNLPLGPALRALNVGICDECGSWRHVTTACPEFLQAMETPHTDREEEAA